MIAGGSDWRSRSSAAQWPGRGDLADPAGEIGADARQLGQRPALRQRGGDVELQVADEARGVAVGTHAERIRLADLEEIGHLLEDPGDVGVVDRHGRDRRPPARDHARFRVGAPAGQSLVDPDETLARCRAKRKGGKAGRRRLFAAAGKMAACPLARIVRIR